MEHGRSAQQAHYTREKLSSSQIMFVPVPEKTPVSHSYQSSSELHSSPTSLLSLELSALIPCRFWLK